MNAIYAYVEKQKTSVLRTDELLRAEWVARVSALDLYVHELVAQKMSEIFLNARIAGTSYANFKISIEAVSRIKSASTATDAAAAFDFEVRRQHSFLTFQDPDKIADAIRAISTIELWNEVALKWGASSNTKRDEAKKIKRQLSQIVERRNKIAHEGDLQPVIPRIPWPIDSNSVSEVANFLDRLVATIDDLVI
uniref:HEPN domain-containing protein n=1 Tax=Herbaspirillum huttiense subsp. nephrolepidis TaxID=3075126 RepID=A0AAE4GF33_9BURK